MWLTENPWPPALACGVVAVACTVLWLQRRQNSLALGGLLGVLAALGCFLVDRLVVTPREQVERRVIELVDDFENRRSEQVLKAFSPQAIQFRALATTALEVVRVEGMKIKDLQVELVSRGTEATSHFRANGRIHYLGQDAGHRPSRWKLVWRREEGTWRIVDVIRLNPLRDEPLPILDADGD